MRRSQWAGILGWTVVASLLCGAPACAQVTVDPAWPENPMIIGGDALDTAESIRPTPDGGYVVAGTSGSLGTENRAVFLLKLDAQGNLDPAWDPNPRAVAGEQRQSASRVEPTSDGGYVVVGNTCDSGECDIYVVKLDGQGNLDPKWDPNPKALGGGYHDEGYSIRETPDDGFVIAGVLGFSLVERTGVYLIKLDSLGNLDPAWDPNPRILGGATRDGACDVEPTEDGFLVAGYLGGDACLYKLDLQGRVDPAWDPNPRTFGGPQPEILYDIERTPDGGYILAGATSSSSAGESDVYLIRVDAQGNLDPAWEPNPKTFGRAWEDRGYEVHLTSDGGTIVLGLSESSGSGTDDGYLIKLDSLGNLDPAWDPNPRPYGGAWTYDVIKSGAPTADGGLLAVGATDARRARNWDAFVLKLASARHFLRGDCNGDGVAQGIPDAIALLRYNFVGGATPRCLAACDADGDGDIASTTDAIYVLRYFFVGTEPPAAPFPACGAGQLWTDGPLGCEIEPECP